MSIENVVELFRGSNGHSECVEIWQSPEDMVECVFTEVGEGHHTVVRVERGLQSVVLDGAGGGAEMGRGNVSIFNRGIRSITVPFHV